MILPIIAAVCCLVAATLMFTPRMRMLPFYRPVSILFLSEGIWLLADYAVSQIAPGNALMDIIHYIILIAVVAWLVISVLVGGMKNKPSGSKHTD